MTRAEELAWVALYAAITIATIVVSGSMAL